MSTEINNHFVTAQMLKAFMKQYEDALSNVNAIFGTSKSIYWVSGATNYKMEVEYNACQASCVFYLAVRLQNKDGLLLVRDAALEVPAEIICEGVYGGKYKSPLFSILSDYLENEISLPQTYELINLKTSGPEAPLLELKKSNLPVIDEIGKSYRIPEEIKTLQQFSINKELTKKLYPLVGTGFYAPRSKNTDVYCVLIAEADNTYDENAIKVLRYLPLFPKEVSRSCQNFFEMGYIARSENSDLYSQMMKQENRLLFSYLEDTNKIRILGSYEQFMNNGRLSKYLLPPIIANLINPAL